MTAPHPKTIRRRILLTLYGRYLENPLHMTSPNELMEWTKLLRDHLPPNIFYLQERDLVELMVGYNPPMFDAVRISPQGIDLVENRAIFNRQYPPEREEEAEEYIDARVLTLQLVKEIEASILEGARREWMIEDLKTLRDTLRGEIKEETITSMHTLLDRLHEYVEDGLGAELPSLQNLEELLRSKNDED